MSGGFKLVHNSFSIKCLSMKTNGLPATRKLIYYFSIMKIILFTVILSMLSNTIRATTSLVSSTDTTTNSTMEGSQELTAITKRGGSIQQASDAAPALVPWLITVGLITVLTGFEIGAQKIAGVLRANKNKQYTDNENFIFENPKDHTIASQAKRLVNQAAIENWPQYPNNDTGVILVPRGDIDETNVFCDRYNWIAVTLERNQKKPKEFDMFVSNTGYLLLHSVPNLASDKFYCAGTAQPKPGFPGPTLPGSRRVITNVTFGADSNGYWHTYKLGKKK